MEDTTVCLCGASQQQQILEQNKEGMNNKAKSIADKILSNIEFFIEDCLRSPFAFFFSLNEVLK